MLVVTVISHHCLLSSSLRDFKGSSSQALSGRRTMPHPLLFTGRDTKGSLGGVLGPAQGLSSEKLFLTLPALRQASTPLSFVLSGLSQAGAFPGGDRDWPSHRFVPSDWVGLLFH